MTDVAVRVPGKSLLKDPFSFLLCLLPHTCVARSGEIGVCYIQRDQSLLTFEGEQFMGAKNIVNKLAVSTENPGSALRSDHSVRIYH